MKERILCFLARSYSLAILFSLVLLLFFTNFQPGTWLSGWDNLHPEFNFSLNIKRSIFAVWQEYQGLGLLGGMGHASDLVRQVILWFFSLFFPVSLLRYFYHFVMLFLGAFGLYFLLKDFILENFPEGQKKIASLAGAVFYLFNLATIQMFYVPFEAYSAHFAALPWLFWANLNFLRVGNQKNLIWLLVFNFLSLTQGYVATFFVVYLIALSLICLFWFFQHRNSLKRILLITLLVLSINAFWLFPNLYFLATSTQINMQAKINQMSTEDNLLKNRKYGTLGDTALLRGFWFDNVEIEETGSANYQFKPWREHLQKSYVAALGYFLFTCSLIGILLALVKKEKRILLFLPVFFLAFLFLSTNTPVFSQISSLFYKIPLLKQIFRFPYTKFAILTAFCLALFYGYFSVLLIKLISKTVFRWIICFAVFFLPVIYLFPVFQGHLFYKKERAKIPEEYFRVFDFFKTQDKNTRIANFPQTTFWGWNFWKFNYSGSGFIWYGIEQPILDRAFDPWSDKNENYYWEISYALYSKNQNLFEKILEKYQINWLLVDENIISPFSAKALFYDELKEMLARSDKVRLVQSFGKIKIYQVDLETPVNNFVFLAENLPAVGPEYKWNNYDAAYLEIGNYISSNRNSVYYPFRSLFTGRTQDDLEFKLEDRGDFFIFQKTIPAEFKDYVLIVPQRENKELPKVDSHDLSKIEYLQPDIFLDGPNLKVKVPKVHGYWSAEIKPTQELSVREAKNCNQFSPGEVKNEITPDGFLRLTSLDALNCSASFWLPNLPHNLAYLITVESRNITGKPLLFWLENLNNRKADIETSLPKTTQTSYFVQPPMEADGLGYVLHFDNISIGRQPTINELGKITANPIPYIFLSELSLRNTNRQLPSQTFELEVNHPNPSLYVIRGTKETGGVAGTVVLSQSYNKGWLAYETNNSLFPFFGKKNNFHVLVNNWENGWMLKEGLKLNEKEKLVIIFLPQYLEYFGFFLLLIFGCSTAYFLLK